MQLVNDEQVCSAATKFESRGESVTLAQFTTACPSACSYFSVLPGRGVTFSDDGANTHNKTRRDPKPEAHAGHWTQGVESRRRNDMARMLQEMARGSH
jgi:hypothetical protein